MTNKRVARTANVGLDSARATASSDVPTSNLSTEQDALRATHTPGPWFVERFEPDELGVDLGEEPCLNIVACGEIVAQLSQLDGEIAPQLEANARLIAAVPDLLKALKDSRCEYCGYGLSCPRTENPCKVCAKRVAAIQKAESGD